LLQAGDGKKPLALIKFLHVTSHKRVERDIEANYDALKAAVLTWAERVPSALGLTAGLTVLAYSLDFVGC